MVMIMKPVVQLSKTKKKKTELVITIKMYFLYDISIKCIKMTLINEIPAALFFKYPVFPSIISKAKEVSKTVSASITSNATEVTKLFFASKADNKKRRPNIHTFFFLPCNE